MSEGRRSGCGSTRASSGEEEADSEDDGDGEAFFFEGMIVLGGSLLEMV